MSTGKLKEVERRIDCIWTVLFFAFFGAVAAGALALMTDPAPRLRTATSSGGWLPPRTGGALPGVLTKSEILRLIQAARGTRLALRDEALLRLAYCTAARVSELTEMRVSGLDRERGRIRFWRPKNNAWHETPVTKDAWDALDRWLDDLRRITRQLALPRDALLFPGRGGKPLRTASVWARLKTLAGLAGVPVERVSPHKLRHSRCTHLLEDGAELDVVQAVAGHKRLETTSVYLHVAEGRVDRRARESTL